MDTLLTFVQVVKPLGYLKSWFKYLSRLVFSNPFNQYISKRLLKQTSVQVVPDGVCRTYIRPSLTALSNNSYLKSPPSLSDQYLPFSPLIICRVQFQTFFMHFSSPPLQFLMSCRFVADSPKIYGVPAYPAAKISFINNNQF